MIGSVIIPALMSIGWRLRLYLSLAGAVLVAIGIAFIKGRADGKATYERQRETAKKKAAQKAEKIRHEIGKSPDANVDRRLGKWMRD